MKRLRVIAGPNGSFCQSSWSQYNLLKEKKMIITAEQQKINTVDALWVLIQGQTKAVKKVLMERLIAEQDKTKVQKAMLKDSLTRAFDELHAGNVRHDARNMFKK